MKLKNIIALFILLFNHGVCYPQQSPAEKPGNTVKIFSTAEILPVLKGLATNPLSCIKIYVPKTKPGTVFTGIHCSLSKDAAAAIEMLEAYFTGTEPLFATGNLIATVSAASSFFSIPVDLNLKPGWHYIWVECKAKG